ncbi:MAG TPA: glycosyltransferase family A protein [Saliniramus sp.]|nr:glycosyltransferase family A protein [Saliniramus sp.]
MNIDDDMISVVVPAHDAAATIGRTLASAQAQTYHPLEIIVVDDGSRDETPRIVDGIAARDPRVRLIRQANAGVAAARNAAIAAARGQLIAPLDADDLWHPKKLELQAAALKKAPPGTGLVYCLPRLIDEADRVIEDCAIVCPVGQVYGPMIYSNFIRCASIPLIRRNLLRTVGGYDPGLRDADAQGAEDFMLYLRLSEVCGFACVERYLVGYRMTHASMSSDEARMLRSWRLVVADARARHPDLSRRLLRWSKGNFMRWLGFHGLSYGNAVAGLRMLASGLVVDPKGSLRPSVLSAVARVCGARLARWLGASLRAPLSTRRTSRGRAFGTIAFAALDPMAETPRKGAPFEIRRMARARALAPKRAIPHLEANAFSSPASVADMGGPR